jgi:hypothetical protein
MNISLKDLAREDAINGTNGYWRARAIMGSRALLIRMRAEHDYNMKRPEGWTKPKPKAPPKPLPPIVFPVIPPVEPYVPTITPSVRSIQDAVASYYGVSRTNLIGKRRTANLMKPRHVATYLAREITKFSTLQLGRFFGNKDHTVILNSVNKMSRQMLVDDDLAFDIATLFEIITGHQQ